MNMRARLASRTTKSTEALADELADRWAPLFTEKDWEKRLELLHLVLEHLQESVADLATYAAVAPVFIRKLIMLLPPEPLSSTAQAHIYANSDDEKHRDTAGRWLAQQSRNGVGQR
jgi:hypothetical protein